MIVLIYYVEVLLGVFRKLDGKWNIEYQGKINGLFRVDVKG